MHEEILYPVCPHRNVAAAYQRFFGPDSGGFERFFPDERTQRFDGTLLIVRLRGKRAVNGAAQAIADFNAGLSALWTATASASWSFALACGSDATQLIARTAALLFGTRPSRLPA